MRRDRDAETDTQRKRNVKRDETNMEGKRKIGDRGTHRTKYKIRTKTIGTETGRIKEKRQRAND